MEDVYLNSSHPNAGEPNTLQGTRGERHLNPPALLRENELNRMTGFVVARESSYSSNDAGRGSSYTSNSNLKSGYNIL